MNEMRFEGFIWNRSNLVTPDGETYRLYKLVVEALSPEQTDHEARYLIKFALTGEALCCVTVNGAEQNSFRQFQNAVFMSRLDMR